MNSKPQLVIISLGFISLVVGIWTMLQAQTLIIPPWILVLLYIPLVLLVAFILGIITKAIIKSNWTRLTFTSLYTFIICFSFFVSEYRSTYKIILPDNYAGPVRLLVSNENSNDFNINSSGIGYISEESYEEGFFPIILKDGKDITKEVSGFSRGTETSTTPDYSLTFKTISFDVSGQTKDFDNISLEELVKRGAVDTTRLLKE